MKTIKNLLYLLAIGLFALNFQSCGEEFKTISVPFDGDEIIFTIPANTSTGEFTSTEEIPSNIDQILQDNNIDSDRIKSITVKSVELNILDLVSPVTFAMIDNVSLKFKSDEYGEEEIASKVFSGEATKTAVLDVKTGDFKKYLSLDNLSYEFKMVTNSPITEETIISAKPKYILKAEIFK